jgi:WD40 repeat protein
VGVGVFEVAIGPGREPGTFRVDVVRSAGGEAAAETVLDAGGLLAGRVAFEQTVLASAVAARQVVSPAERVVREAGQALFGALLGSGAVAGRYEASAALAAGRGEELRIVLRIDAPELAGLPWEAMYDAGAGGYVCRLHELVRHVPVAAVPPPLEVRLPLQVLGVISAPRGLAGLDTERERDQLERALGGLAGQRLATVTWAPPTWAGLHEMLLAGPWHVLHFIGHGDFDPGSDEGVLALTGEDGRADLVEASQFADLLRQARPMPRLVVLNSCSGAAASTGDLFSGTAAALARSGVAAVAAMQYAISDPAAVAFARGFYAALARGRGVDEAVTAGRIAILGTGRRTLEWITPVLYLRGDSTRLFTIPAGTVPADEPAPQPRRAEPPPAAPASAPAAPRARAPSRLLRKLSGHTGALLGVAFSPDGTRLATTSADQTARLWDIATGAHIRTLTGHTGAVWGVAFSPDGTRLATTSSDETVRLWDTATGTHIRTLTGHTSVVTGAAFSPDGTRLATTSNDQTARLWDTATGTHIRTLTGHTSYVLGVAFSPDGALLATAGGDKTARLWDTAGGTSIRILTGHDSIVWGVAFSPDGTLLATASSDKTARVWDTAAGTTIRTLTGHDNYVRGVAFSPDGARLATASADNTARLWDTATGTTIRTLTGHTGWLNAVAFSPDGTLLATASRDNTGRLWV